MFTAADIERVKARVELASLVRERVKLRRAGKNLLGLCPFHQEHTPSFNVYADSFHCFGCKASGDAIEWLRRTEGADFHGAVLRLAELAGIELEEEGGEQAKVERARVRELSERLRHACAVAQEFFLESERMHGVAARELARRAIPVNAAVEAFGIGYAPAAWDSLTQALALRGVSPADAEAAGLLVPKKRTTGWVDRFRHRVTFPVHDAQGRIVGFSAYAVARGDVPEELQGAGKYTNGPETPIYHKGSLLFGLWAARTAVSQSDEAVIVEGNFDVVHMHAHGFTNTVAPLGSAFTEEHADLVRRRAGNVTLAFDADEPGRKATQAARALLAPRRVDIRVVTWPAKHDPDSALAEFGPDAVRDIIARAAPASAWAVEHIAMAAGRGARRETLEAVADVLADEHDPLVLLPLVDALARRLHAPAAAVQAAIRAARGARTRGKATTPPAGARTAPARAPARPTMRTEAIRAALGRALAGSGEAPSDAGPFCWIFEACRDSWESHGTIDVRAIAARAQHPQLRAWLLARAIEQEQHGTDKQEQEAAGDHANPAPDRQATACDTARGD